MGGTWDESRPAEVVQNAFGKAPQIRTCGRLVTKAGKIDKGNVGVVVK